MEIIKTIIGLYFNILVLILPKAAAKQSFYFFCIPFKAKLKPNQQAFLETAKIHSLPCADKTIRCYEWGEGSEIILFVHGWQSNSYRWKLYIENLDKMRYKLVAVDAPGHGNSDGLYSNVPLFEQALSSVVTHFGNPQSIVSHSIGAFASLYFMHKNDIKVERFVSMAPPYSAEQFVEVYQSELKLSEKLVRNLKGYFEKYTTHPLEYYSLKNFAQSISSECLLIHDLKDMSTSSSNSVKLHKELTNSTLNLTDGHGHRLRSKEIIDQVSDFVR